MSWLIALLRAIKNNKNRSSENIMHDQQQHMKQNTCTLAPLLTVHATNNIFMYIY